MRNSITIRRPSRLPARPVAIALPRSKSVANRALLIAGLAGDLRCIEQPGDAEDTRILLQLLEERPRVMHCGLGGTTFRFLLAWAAVQEGEEHLITGEARLLERPHGALVEALRQLGASVELIGEGYRVRGRKMDGGTITFDSPISSQYLSALMLIAPLMRECLRIEWKGRQLSRPYVGMTAKVMDHFGARTEMGPTSIQVHAGRYRAAPFEVPRDWSAAAFWLESRALVQDLQVELVGLQGNGWQGDEAAARLWPELEKDADAAFDLADTPDLFQPLAFTCAGLGKKATFTGLDNLPLKETDRLQAVAAALGTLGCHASYQEGTFTLKGRITNRTPPPFDPQGDHRMAMALAPLALVCEAITILDPEVVGKSYPGFWDDLRRAGFRLSVR